MLVQVLLSAGRFLRFFLALGLIAPCHVGSLLAEHLVDILVGLLHFDHFLPHLLVVANILAHVVVRALFLQVVEDALVFVRYQFLSDQDGLRYRLIRTGRAQN